MIFIQIMILANTTSVANMPFCLEMSNLLNHLCYILRDMRWLPHISTCINIGVINIYEVVLMIYFSCSYTNDGGPVCNVNPFTKFCYSPISTNDSWGTNPISYEGTAKVLRHIGCAVMVCAKV